MPFIKTPLRPVPERLFHYTSERAAESILKGGRNNKEICFWAKNATCKNDKSELELGKRIYEHVHRHLQNEGRHSLLGEVKINPDLVFMNSFTDSAFVNSHMLDIYGCIRLEFDFRGLFDSLSLRECDYILDEDIPELFGSYCEDFDEYLDSLSKGGSDFLSLIQYLHTEMGVILSIPFLKHLKQWGMESEWRHVLYRQPIDSRIFSLYDGQPKMKVFYPSCSLVGITCFVSDANKSSMLSYYTKYKYLVDRNKWDAKVERTEVN